MAAHHHIFDRGHIGKQADVLEGSGDAAGDDPMGRLAVDFFAGKNNLA